MRIRTVVVIGLLVLVLALPLSALSGCTARKAKTNARKPAKKTKKTDKVSAGHTISAETRDEILRDAREAISLLEPVREDTAALNTFLADPLRAQTAAQISADGRAGRVKVRRLTDPKFTFKNAIKNIAGVMLTFKDNGYYIDKKTGRQLTKPTGSTEKRILALRKADGKWKIYSILGKTKPAAQSPPATKN
ncbi:MAG: hypothetical protein Q8L35_04980 [Actinomycetota bacterium]|nr:hypothetical protein [Actinomycetota bacterium]